MLKIILTAAIVLSVGVLSLLKTTTPAKSATVTTVKLMVDNRTVLATAD
ncbi:hypothetical protein [Mucilaginibacter sp. UR6-11]|nr:hypothetical protein [Mucilaginibacter sp. UR6-11]MCC8426640.1 hypothetical protein [Mucilaginibacter sp. UR6-11]